MLDLAKLAWGPGPWQEEPDRLQFQHAGLPCMAIRNDLGSWCGYAAVFPGHPLYGKEPFGLDLRVHGGLNYGSRCTPGICHTPAPGEPADVWWLGFDCSHGFDLAPAGIGFFRTLTALGREDQEEEEPRLFRHQQYRDFDYVVAQVRALAEQLAVRGLQPEPREDSDYTILT